VGDGFHERSSSRTSRRRRARRLELALAPTRRREQLEAGERKQRGEIASWDEDACALRSTTAPSTATTTTVRPVAHIHRAARVRVRVQADTRTAGSLRSSSPPTAVARGDRHLSAHRRRVARTLFRSLVRRHGTSDVARGTFEHVSTRSSAERDPAVLIAALVRRARSRRAAPPSITAARVAPAAGAPRSSLFGATRSPGVAGGLLGTTCDGALRALPRWQERGSVDGRAARTDAAPAPQRTARGARLEPWTRHYGAATTSAFYPVALSELWHWTAIARVRLIEPALSAALARQPQRRRRRRLLRLREPLGGARHQGGRTRRTRSSEDGEGASRRSRRARSRLRPREAAHVRCSTKQIAGTRRARSTTGLRRSASATTSGCTGGSRPRARSR
jgi:hypothetical protein